MKKFFTFFAAMLFAGSMMAEPITVAQALQIAGQLEQGASTKDTFEIVGYVTAYAGADAATDGGWSKYRNQIFWIADAQGTAASNADGALEIYQGVPTEQVYVGDKVSVTAQLTNYNGLLETVKKGTVTILEKVERPEPTEADADVVFSGADFNGQGTASTGSPVSATKDGVTFECNKAYGDSAYATLRCYKNGVITITSETEQIGKLKFQFYSTYTGDLNNEVVVNATQWTYTLTSQARIEKLEVYFGEYDTIVPPVVGIDTVNVAEAVAIGMALEDNAKTDKEYVVYGHVVQAYAPNEGFTDQTWFMADEEGAYGEFEAYRCTPDTLVETGDYVYVKGKIQKYVKDSKTQIEIGYGTAVHGATPAPPQVDTITVTEALEIAKALAPEKGKSLKTDVKYAVWGYVTKVKDAAKYTYYMADEAGAYGEFQAYRCASIDYEVAEGDVVIVTGYIMHYYGEGSSGEYHNYEISGGALVHENAQGIENVVLTEKAQKVMVDGVMFIIRDGKMYNVQGAQVR